MLKILPTYLSFENKITKCLDNFSILGDILAAGKRNTIKIFFLNNSLTLNVKSFKKPHYINKFIYRYFRKSKAKRSFEYATLLIEKQIGTPRPIALKENYSNLGLLDSYYVCEHINCDLTYRELVETNYPDSENILRQFVHFTYKLHQNGIEFLDHTPGNTLIKNNHDGTYNFYLVDLNRMKFHNKMPFKTRMKNISKITPKKEMVIIMSNEYAKISNENESLILDTIWQFTQEFQARIIRKKNLKKIFRF